MSLKEKAAAAASEKLMATLQSAGLRRTKPRLAVLRRLGELQAPVSHGELADSLGRLDRATVYRTLTDFTEAGLVARTDLGDHVWRFGLVRAGQVEHGQSHPHLICTECNRVSCLPGVKVQLTLPRGQKRLGSAEVQLKGMCEDCAR
jgi:Fur family ferric uptake transcriptional regulator